MYDCVVIPGFGGFIGSYWPAVIQPRTHLFSPPSKKLVFNAHLKTDDGLLIHHIALQENLSYTEVREMIEWAVKQWEHDLAKGKRIVFPAIGAIVAEKENNLVFTPDITSNYLDSSFGLDSFTSPPIDRRRHQDVTVKKFIDRRPGMNSRRKAGIYRSAAAALPVLFLVLWVIFFGTPGFMEFNEKSSMMPETNLTEDKGQGEYLQYPQESNPVLPIQSAPDDVPDGRESGTESRAAEKTAPDNELSKPDDRLRFFIIGGAFKEAENVQNLMDKLLSEGFEPVIAGTTAAGLTMVSIQAFRERKEALAALEIIRQNTNPNAWLYRK